MDLPYWEIINIRKLKFEEHMNNKNISLILVLIFFFVQPARAVEALSGPERVRLSECIVKEVYDCIPEHFKSMKNADKGERIVEDNLRVFSGLKNNISLYLTDMASDNGIDRTLIDHANKLIVFIEAKFRQSRDLGLPTPGNDQHSRNWIAKRLKLKELDDHDKKFDGVNANALLEQSFKFMRIWARSFLGSSPDLKAPTETGMTTEYYVVEDGDFEEDQQRNPNYVRHTLLYKENELPVEEAKSYLRDMFQVIKDGRLQDSARDVLLRAMREDLEEKLRGARLLSEFTGLEIPVPKAFAKARDIIKDRSDHWTIDFPPALFFPPPPPAAATVVPSSTPERATSEVVTPSHVDGVTNAAAEPTPKRSIKMSDTYKRSILAIIKKYNSKLTRIQNAIENFFFYTDHSDITEEDRELIRAKTSTLKNVEALKKKLKDNLKKKEDKGEPSKKRRTGGE